VYIGDGNGGGRSGSRGPFDVESDGSARFAAKAYGFAELVDAVGGLAGMGADVPDTQESVSYRHIVVHAGREGDILIDQVGDGHKHFFAPLKGTCNGFCDKDVSCYLILISNLQIRYVGVDDYR